MVRLAWQEKKTDSGIQLASGPTTIECAGEVMGVIPGQDQSGKPLLLYVVRRDGDDTGPHIIPTGNARFVD